MEAIVDRLLVGLSRSLGPAPGAAVRVFLVAALLAAVAPAGFAWARGGPKPFQRVGKSCAHGQPCGSAAECFSGICIPKMCGIDGVLYAEGTRNPSNPCQACRPGRNYRGWSNANDGTLCGNPTGDECVSSFSTCFEGECVPQPLPDGSGCGDGQFCCGGGCCAAGEACGSGGCEPGDDDGDDGCTPGTCPDDPTGCDDADCEPTCSIDGVVYNQGATDPARQCWECNPTFSTTQWSLRADNERCGTDNERFCCNGECCGIEQCCGGLSCTFDYTACFPEG